MSSSFFVRLSEIAGIPEDFVRICLIFILNILLSPLFHKLKSPNLRLLYSGVVGVIFLHILLDQWAYYVILSGIVSYFAIAPFRKNQLLISLIVSFTFLLYIHFYRYLYDYESWKLDCSVPQMMLTTRIVYFGKYLSGKGKASLTEYLSYIFFFPGVAIGPTFSFETFLAFIRKEHQYTKEIPLPKKQFAINMIKGLFMAALTVVVVPIFSADWFTTNPYFLENTLPMKIFLLSTVATIMRVKFYSGWAFTQAAVDLSGLSYDKNGGFTEVHIGSERYELEYNPRIKTESWNTSVQLWLKNCIYDPVSAGKGASSGAATLVVFFVSAVWHGVYPTYYLGFLQWALIANISRFCYKASFKLGKIADAKWFKAIVWVITNFYMNWIGAFIVILDTNKGIAFYSSMYWIGTITFIVVHAFFSITGWGQKVKKQDSAKEKPTPA